MMLLHSIPSHSIRCYPIRSNPIQPHPVNPIKPIPWGGLCASKANSSPSQTCQSSSPRRKTFMSRDRHRYTIPHCLTLSALLLSGGRNTRCPAPNDPPVPSPDYCRAITIADVCVDCVVLSWYFHGACMVFLFGQSPRHSYSHTFPHSRLCTHPPTRAYVPIHPPSHSPIHPRPPTCPVTYAHTHAHKDRRTHSRTH